MYNDIIRNGVLLIVYVFAIFVIWIVLSSPFETMMTSFDDINGTYDAEVEAGTANNRLVFDIFFAGLAISGVVWFIVWVFRREPDWGFGNI